MNVSSLIKFKIKKGTPKFVLLLSVVNRWQTCSIFVEKRADRISKSYLSSTADDLNSS